MEWCFAPPNPLEKDDLGGGSKAYNEVWINVDLIRLLVNLKYSGRISSEF